MLHPARLLTALVVFVVAVVLREFVGEVGADEPAPERRTTASARHNTPIAQELTQRWRMLPRVLEAHAGYSDSDEYAVIVANAVCEKCNRQTLLARLARDIWVSDLQGLTSFKVSVAHEDGRRRPVTRTWNVRKDARELYDRYGNGLVDPDTLDD